jgi:hypothetical protein
LANEPNPKLKVALLAAARRQVELDDALADLEDKPIRLIVRVTV